MVRPAFPADLFIFAVGKRCGWSRTDRRFFLLPLRVFRRKLRRLFPSLSASILAASNPIRQVLATYLHLAGIETGYGYFAPNVPGSYKLVFELHYPDGRVEYELPSVSSAAAGLRLAGLLDKIGRTPYDALAGTSGENAGAIDLARASRGEDSSRRVWIDQVPKRKRIRATVKENRTEFLYAYDFSLREESAEPNRSLIDASAERTAIRISVSQPRPIIGWLFYGSALVFK